MIQHLMTSWYWWVATAVLAALLLAPLFKSKGGSPLGPTRHGRPHPAVPPRRPLGLRAWDQCKKAASGSARALNSGMKALGKGVTSLLTSGFLVLAALALITYAATHKWWREFPGSENPYVAAGWQWYADHWGVILTIVLLAFLVTLILVSLFKADKGKVTPWIAVFAIVAIIFATEAGPLGHLYDMAWSNGAAPSVNVNPTFVAHDAFSDADFDCSPANHCESGIVDSPQGEAGILIEDRYHRTSNINVCIDPELKAKEDGSPAPIFLSVMDQDGRQNGVEAVSERYAASKVAVGESPIPTKRFLCVRGSTNRKSCEFWFTRSTSC